MLACSDDAVEAGVWRSWYGQAAVHGFRSFRSPLDKPSYDDYWETGYSLSLPILLPSFVGSGYLESS